MDTTEIRNQLDEAQIDPQKNSERINWLISAMFEMCDVIDQRTRLRRDPLVPGVEDIPGGVGQVRPQVDSLGLLARFYLQKMASIDSPYDLFEPYLWKDKVGDGLWHCEMRSVDAVLARGKGVTINEAIVKCHSNFCGLTPDIEGFINDIVKVYQKYGLSLAHEDSQGSFLVEKYDDSNIEWLKNARRNSTPDRKAEDVRKARPAFGTGDIE